MPPELSRLATLVRYYILRSTTKAGSGHPSTSLSATDLMVGLLFGGAFRADLDHPEYPNNDRLIFSKGHASPLLYALYAAAGKVSEEELDSLRKFGSPLEGHPTLAFPYTEAATGSLGQGLAIGVGMALNAKLDSLPYRTYVLLGDSEMAEGSVWEAMQSAAFYKLDNLVGILDVNRLGQRGETMYGHNLKAYEDRVSAFGWDVCVIDGHNLDAIVKAYERAFTIKDKPVMIIAKTLKGKGVAAIEDKDGWHGKALPQEEYEKAISELGEINKTMRGEVASPGKVVLKSYQESQVIGPSYDPTKPVATRRAYGNAVTRLYPQYPDIVVLDAEVSNSTYAELFAKKYPKRFFEMYIMEQNMAGVALGFSRRGKIPFISTFAAFFSRAYDQIRMSQYADANIKFVGSHAGVSIGEDGASQMGLEDLSLFRALLGSAVLYPSDAYAAEKLVEEAAKYHGNVYIRTTRKDTQILYGPDEQFPIGGSKVLCSSQQDSVTVLGAGITLYEALAAYDALQKEGIVIRVVDLYSIKPLDLETLLSCARETKALIVVEDHYAEGGIGEAVSAVLAGEQATVYSLAVRKMPKSGKPDELLAYEEINKDAIVRKIKEIMQINSTL